MSENMLNDKVVLVAGAAGTLGREIVKAITEQGGTVVAMDTDLALMQTLPELSDIPEGHRLLMDITSEKSIQLVFEQASGIFPQIDGAVNACYPRNENYGCRAFDVTLQDFNQNVSMHLGGYFSFMQHCARYAKDRNSAFSLVNLASIYGVIAPKFDVYSDTNMTMPVEYAAIKAGLLHLNCYFTKYMKGTHFRSNCVSPGGIEQNQEERFLEGYARHCVSKGMLDASDVTGAIVFLLSHHSTYIKGQNLIVDDGFSV